MEKDEEARSAALGLIARGLITPGQAAELAGVSRQLVHYWLKKHDIRWQATHDARLAKMWRKEIAALNGKVIREPSKRAKRRFARIAKARWDKANGKHP